MTARHLIAWMVRRRRFAFRSAAATSRFAARAAICLEAARAGQPAGCDVHRTARAATGLKTDYIGAVS